MAMTVEHLSFSYNSSREILTDISFSLPRGRSLFLLGPNGTGKTTLLKCLNHILNPTKGRVCIEGEDVAGFSAVKIARNIGYVPQYNNNVFSMNVIDTIMMGRIAFAGYQMKSHDKDVVFDLIDKLNLQDFAFRSIGEMSGGERQRVFIARALAQEPKFILLDEPTSSLDLKNQMFSLELITELCRSQNLGMILSIHDLNLTSLFADQVMILKNSKIYAYGKPEETITEETVRSVYEVSAAVTTEDGCSHVRLIRNR